MGVVGEGADKELANFLVVLASMVATLKLKANKKPEYLVVCLTQLPGFHS